MMLSRLLRPLRQLLVPASLFLFSVGGAFAQSTSDDMPPPESYQVSVHPGAFVDTFEMSIELTEPDSLVLGGYDASSRQVVRLDLGWLEPGVHLLEIDGSNWPGGSVLLIVTGASGRKGSTRIVKISGERPSDSSSLLPPLAPNP